MTTSIPRLQAGMGGARHLTRRPEKRRGGMFEALHFRNYRLFWTGQLVSVTGTFMQGTAQQWLVLQLSKDPLALGVVGALQFGPSLVPLGAAVADRWPRRNVLVVTQAISGLLALLLFTLTVTHLVQIWHIYLLAFLLGLVNAVDMPSRQAFISEMVPGDYLLNAVSLNSAQFNVARIAGPGIAGALIALLGVPVLFLLNALSFVAVICGLLLMRVSDLVPVPNTHASRGIQGRLRDIGGGFRFIFGNRTVLITFIMIATVGTMGFNFNVVLPLEATSVLHAGPAVFGLLTSSLGVGALLGALMLARRSAPPTNTLLIATAAIFGLLEAAIALPATIPVVLAVIAVTGIFMSTFGASVNTRIQLSSPPELRGRVMAVFSMVWVGTTPIGNLIVSGVARSAGVHWSLAVSGIPCFLSAVVAFALWRHESRVAAARQPITVAPSPLDATVVPAAPALAEDLPRGANLRGFAARLRDRVPGRPNPHIQAARRD